MVKLRRGLLVALVLICALAANVWAVDSHASTLGHRVLLQSPSKTGPTTAGEPDVGQGKDPPKTPQGYRESRKNADWAQQVRWIRWTSGIWMARCLGVSFRF